jgi:transcriptional regulator of acetoin/glycerol metabolism
MPTFYLIDFTDVIDFYAMKNYSYLVNIAKEWLISSCLDTKTIYSAKQTAFWKCWNRFRLAPLNKPVLIIGERGTGKELIANRLHYLSGRWDGPFISLTARR